MIINQLGERVDTVIDEDITRALISGEDFLEHFGVKGMHWGIRNDTSGLSRKEQKADSRWANGVLKSHVLVDISNAVAKRSSGPHGIIAKINNDPKFKSLDFSKDTPLRKKYYETHQEAYLNTFNEEAQKRVGLSPSGRLSVVIGADASTGIPHMFVVEKVVKHADDNSRIEIPLVIDAKGMIIGYGTVVPTDTVTHSDIELDEDFLEHYGVKGMHWGVRKARNERARAATFGKGSAYAKAHPDYQAVAGLRGKPISTLSNDQLKLLSTRLNLEQNVARLTPGTVDKGQERVKKVLAATNLAVNTFNSPLGKGLIALGTVAVAAGTRKFSPVSFAHN